MPYKVFQLARFLFESALSGPKNGLRYTEKKSVLPVTMVFAQQWHVVPGTTSHIVTATTGPLLLQQCMHDFDNNVYNSTHNGTLL